MGVANLWIKTTVVALPCAINTIGPGIRRSFLWFLSAGGRVAPISITNKDGVPPVPFGDRGDNAPQTEVDCPALSFRTRRPKAHFAENYQPWMHTANRAKFLRSAGPCVPLETSPSPSLPSSTARRVGLPPLRPRPQPRPSTSPPHRKKTNSLCTPV